MNDPKITFKVSPQELEEVLRLKEESGLTWRELIFKALGLSTKRRVGGPKRTIA